MLPLVFALGPADGFSKGSLQGVAAHSTTISLGKMTLAHELARVVLLEQIYRAFYYPEKSSLPFRTLMLVILDAMRRTGSRASLYLQVICFTS